MAGNDKPTDSSGEVARDYELYRAESFKQVFDLYKETMELKDVIAKKDTEIANLKSVIAEKETEIKQNRSLVERQNRGEMEELKRRIFKRDIAIKEYDSIISSNIDNIDELRAELMSLIEKITEHKVNMEERIPGPFQDYGD